MRKGGADGWGERNNMVRVDVIRLRGGEEFVRHGGGRGVGCTIERDGDAIDEITRTGAQGLQAGEWMYPTSEVSKDSDGVKDC